VTGLQEGASGMITQPKPFSNELYPESFIDLALFAGAGLAWNRRAAAICLGVEAAAEVPGGDAADQETRNLYAEQLYGDERCPPEDKAHIVSLLCASHESIASFWRDQRLASVPEIDEALWRLHAVDGRLPDHIVVDEHAPALTAAIGDTYRDFVRQLKEDQHSWSRQESHRWMESETYAMSVSAGSRVQHQLDQMHVVIDLLRLSCKLLNHILLLAQSLKNGNGNGGADEKSVEFLIKSIPSSTRSDLANRFLDLYQRMAVLWSHNHVKGLTVVVRPQVELLRYLAHDLQNGRQFSETFFNGIFGQDGRGAQPQA